MEPNDERLAVVLAATDFSDTAKAGLDWAAELASQHGARLVLVHATSVPAPMQEFLPVPGEVGIAVERAALERLEEEARRVRRGGVEVETDLRIGIPSASIVEAAKERSADLVVVGTRGLSGLQHLLLGSTAERVVQRAACPVLTIHPGDAEKHRRVRTVLVPTDFSEDARLAVAHARRLLAPLDEGARLVLLHAYHLPVEYTAYGAIPTSLDYLQDVGAAAQERLDEIAAELGRNGLEIEARAKEGYPPDLIVREAERVKADLIAMGTHGRSGLAHLLLGSTAERVVQKAPCPVLTIRRPR